jgi:hypothetical protein
MMNDEWFKHSSFIIYNLSFKKFSSRYTVLFKTQTVFLQKNSIHHL